MKKIVYGILATLSGLVLLFSYKTSWNESAVAADSGTISGGTTTSDTSSSSSSTDSSTSSDDESSETSDSSESGEDDSTSSTTTDSSSSSSTTTTASGLTDGTYTGTAANTRYGAVQVTITVSGGEITSVDVPQYPQSDRRDIEINQRALPTLIDETISAQSSSINMVSGATYTSQGYIQSLQSAIDQATA